jgi:ubiquinone/menaquinone biosynthesis C-methylase UbiE
MTDRWQLTGSGPESYERYQVPSVFEPLARKFLDRVQLRSGERVLDVACGTGIVARLAASTLGAYGVIIGIDLNEKMLELARVNGPRGGAHVEWKQGDAGALPCRDDDFDVVLCQQGLQFLPDKAAAVREMHRVLRTGGRLGLCVWRSIEHSPCHVAIAKALRRHVGADIAQRFQAPFSFGDADTLKRSVADAGFRAIDIQVDVLMRRLLPPQQSIPGLLASTPAGPEVAALQESTRGAIVDEVAAELAAYRTVDGLEVPQPTHVVLAVK